VSGIAQVVSAFGLPTSAGARILLFISGAASVILAVLAFRHVGEGYAILLLAIWIAVGFIFRGVAATASAISDPAFPGRGWAIFFGIISIIAGIVVLAWPFDSIVTMALVVGIWLIILGVMEVVAGSACAAMPRRSSRRSRALRPDSALFPRIKAGHSLGRSHHEMCGKRIRGVTGREPHISQTSCAPTPSVIGGQYGTTPL